MSEETTDLDYSDIESATYSVEDNKLRLYSICRLDADVYAKVKAMGFRYAPKQELFVAPAWTPEREDFCIEVAGEIQPEQTTLVERAQAKAARLDDLAARRASDADVFFNAAQEISKRFAQGQPILVGHHSERKARKDQDRMNRAMDKAAKAHNAIGYWMYRARGVERNANRKANPDTRQNRIKKLLADMRKVQSYINEDKKRLYQWAKLDLRRDHPDYSKHVFAYAGLERREDYKRLESVEVTPVEFVAEMIERYNAEDRHNTRYRWINHLLARISYERSELGSIPRYEGELTAVILQRFARTMGADKPKAKPDQNNWTLTSPVDLPMHINPKGSDTLACGTPDYWRDLMQRCGYHVEFEAPVKPEKTRATGCPLINLSAEDGQKLVEYWASKYEAVKRCNGMPKTHPREVLEMTANEYSHRASGSGWCYTVIVTQEGDPVTPYEAKQNGTTGVCRVRIAQKGFAGAFYLPVTLTDRKTKPLPIKLPE